MGIHILLIQVFVILALSRVLGWVMRLFRQPQVIGEMIAGIMLGPSLLGLIHQGQWMTALFPTDSLGHLEVLSQLGVMLFMFLVGLEMDVRLLRGQGKAALVTGTVGIVIPFLGGIGLGLLLIASQPAITGAVPSPLVLCMFLGAAMSITAFPVLARILTERNLHKTRTGVLAITCAAMDDVMGWCILAIVLATAQLKGFGADSHASSSAVRAAAITIGASLVYIAVMLFVVRRFMGRLEAMFETRGYLSQDVLAIVFLLLMASAWATDAIGIHQIFGAFMFGVVMPKSGPFIKALSEKVEDFTVLFLLPLFFAYTGLRTELNLLGTAHLWLWCGVVLAVAIGGKFGGVTLAARFYGMNWRRSSLLGVLMNTRGLIELIILNIGLSFGVLSKPLFAMMVVMALTTTFITTPLMRLLYSPARQRRELDEAAREEAVQVQGMHVVVPVSLESTAGALVRIARLLMGENPGRLYALHLERPTEVDRRAHHAEAAADAVLEVAVEAAKREKLPCSSVSFVSRHIGQDIVDSARQYVASWIVMGWHKPIFSGNVLGGIVGQVLQRSPANVAIVQDKGLGEVRRVLVPYLDAALDREALRAALRLAATHDVQLTVLRVAATESAATTLPSLVDPETRRPLPADVDQQTVVAGDAQAAIIEASGRADLLILALCDDLPARSGPLSPLHAGLFEGSRCSVILVHSNPGAPVVESERTATKNDAAPKLAPAVA